jgi:glutamyl-tRNA reductase
VSVVVIGVNHRTAPLELLERMTIGDGELPKALHQLTGTENLSEAVVLSTCNRIEIYGRAERFHGAYADVRNFLADSSFLPPEQFSDHLYSYFDTEAVNHLFSVIAGMDSAVLGENEIQGQVRRAWTVAREQDAAGPTLNLLFRRAIEAGKRARTETGINRHITSVSQAAVAMAQERLGHLNGRSVLVVGAGEMGEGMANALADAGADDIRVANRTAARAHELAQRTGGAAVSLLDLPDQLAEVDVVLTSTGSEVEVIDEEDLAPIVEARPDRPLLVVDIAVPRDVAPAVGQLPGVTLLDMDDLRRFADAGVAERRREAARVGTILDDELTRYRQASTATEMAPVVVALRQQAEDVRAAELERFRRRHSYLGPDELAAVEALSRSLVAKLVHQPTVALKDAAGTARGERLLTALQDLYGLSDDGEGDTP